MGLLNKMMFSGMVGYMIGTRQFNQQNQEDAEFAFEPGTITPNTVFDSNRDITQSDHDSAIHPSSIVKGDIEMGNGVQIGAFCSLHGENGNGIYVGTSSVIQDGVIIEGFASLSPTFNEHTDQDPSKHSRFRVYIEDETFISYQAQIQGPVRIGRQAYIGPQALVSNSDIGERAIIAPGANVIGVRIEPNRLVPAGVTIASQESADNLPPITSSDVTEDI